MKKIISFLLLAVMVFTSCVEEYNAELPEGETDLLVVEGTIISDSLCTFHLTKTYSLNNTSNQIPVVNNAFVRVSGSDGTVWKAIAGGQGSYSIPVGHLNANTEYQLEIEADGVTYTSTPQRPVSTENIKLSFTQNKPEENVQILVSTAPTNDAGTHYYKMYYEEDWEVITPYDPTYEYDPRTDKIVEMDYHKNRGWIHTNCNSIILASTINFSGNQLQEAKVYSAPIDDTRFTTMYASLVKVRSISQGEYEYEQIRAQISSEMGGLFTPQPSELPTNISSSDKQHKAIGYIGISSNVSQQRMFIYPRDVNSTYKQICDVLSDEDLAENTPKELYQKGYQIGNYEVFPTGKIEEWTKDKCVDARLLGATFYRPEFWP